MRGILVHFRWGGREKSIKIRHLTTGVPFPESERTLLVIHLIATPGRLC
jgi:hypothetical protein